MLNFVNVLQEQVETTMRKQNNIIQNAPTALFLKFFWVLFYCLFIAFFFFFLNSPLFFCHPRHWLNGCCLWAPIRSCTVLSLLCLVWCLGYKCSTNAFLNEWRQEYLILARSSRKIAPYVEKKECSADIKI